MKQPQLFPDGSPADPASPEEAAATTLTLRVLIIEDSENDYLLLMNNLRRGGFAPEGLRLETEEALLQALEGRDWDLVLADFHLPRFDAQAALKLVRHYNPEIPFIIVSGALHEDLAALTLAAGANDALAKENLTRLPAVVERELRAAGDRRTQRALVVSAQQVSEALKNSQARFLQLTQHLPECFWLYDVGSRQIVYVNEAYSRITGRPLDRFYSDPSDLARTLHPLDAVRFAEAQERQRFGGIDDEYRVIRPNGELRWIHMRTFPVRDERQIVRSVGGIVSDITEAVSQQHQLQRLAHFDALTGLPNRILFKERLSASLAMARRNNWLLAVLFIDLDRFKIINDTLGHGAGDDLLRQVAIRMRTVVRESDTVSRLGGDEFAIVLPDLPTADDAASVARKLVDVLASPFAIQGQNIYVSASIGITLFPDDSDDVDSLIRNADAAMYRAKDSGRNNYQFYRAEMNLRARELLALEVDLRQALIKREFELHYQPKVSLETGLMTGVEALIRWRNRERGLVSPGDFVPLLEETGIIVAVGEWVLREACRQMRSWHQAGHGELSVAVNLSARQLEGQALVDTVRNALQESGLPPGALELELTESMLMQDAPAVESLLAQLKAMGLRLSIDDFGTGYSSLAYLKRFPIDTLKVDRSFVRDITVDPDDASITRAVIQMAHELSLTVVAEGVETAAQLQLLAANSCDQIQGFFFSRPLPPTALGELLQAGKRLAPEHRRLADHNCQVLLLGPATDAVAQLLTEHNGYDVRQVATAEQARLWLTDHPCELLLALGMTGDADTRSLFGESNGVPQRALVLLCGEQEWPLVARAWSNIHLDQRLPWPAAPEVVLQALRAAIDGRRRQVVTARQTGEYRALLHTTVKQEEEIRRLRVEQTTSYSVNACASVQRLLQEFTVGIVGVDADGLIVLINEQASKMCAPLQPAPTVGLEAREALPEDVVARLGAPGVSAIEIAGRPYQLVVETLRFDSEIRGHLLLLTHAEKRMMQLEATR
jgi:diguanylate cyclase (GGDEF)-like protein/PAS domain S-box-containing protein